ncbi:MAG: tail fiber domain-containing protein, partial [Bacteroidia bacterium]
GQYPGGSGWAIFANGWAGGTTNWLNVSDKRLKTNIQPINGALSKLMNINAYTYEYSSQFDGKYNLPKGKQIGFIAQELETVFPELVHEKGLPTMRKISDKSSLEKEPNQIFKTVDYTSLIPVLVEAIKAQQKLIEDQQKQIDELKQLIKK